MQIDVTLVITAFDRKDSLISLLEGLNKQTVSPEKFEIIIADDSAEMNIAEQALRCVKTRYCVSIVTTGLAYQVNGVSVARNMGIKMAKGSIIISLDDDCIPNPYLIEEHLSFHEKGYPVIVLGHRSESLDKLNQNKPISVSEEKAFRELICSASDQLNFFNFMTGNISLPKQIIMKSGMFNETFAQPGEHGWEDIELGYRLWHLGYRTVFARNALVYRPATEKEKEEKRASTNATQKAWNRFIDLQPLVPGIIEVFQAILQNRKEEAKELAEKVLNEDPKNHGILMRLGEIYLQDNDIESAYQCFSEAQNINMHHPFVHEKLGEISYRQGRYREALESFSQSLELDPNRPRSLYFVALSKNTFNGNNLFSQVCSRDVNVELGGGIFPTKIREEEQDDFINVDIMNWPLVDVLTDIKNPLPFPNETVNCIFSREVIEHLPYKALPKLIQECFRVLKHGGRLYLCCPDLEAIMALYDKKCLCIGNESADTNCPKCNGKALVSEDYWRSNLLGNQNDYGDEGMNDTHKNQISFSYLKSLLAEAGFTKIERDHSNKFYEAHKKIIKLSVNSLKP
jgi:glycosyltransferase involved in cell wall biosynthesis